MYYPPPQQGGYVPPPYPPQNMNMTGGYMAPPPPSMVPQGMYPVSMGSQPRQGPYPPQQSRPPQQQQSYPPPMPPMAPRPQQPTQPTPPPSQPKVTPETMPLPNIDTLSDEKVEELLRDDAALVEYVRTLPYMLDYALKEQAVNQLQDEVNSLSARIAANPELEAARREVEQKRFEFQDKTARKQAKESELTPQVLLEKLDAKAKAVDAECEEIAGDFLSGETNAKDFAKNYKDKRFYFHTLSAKKESILHNM